MKREVLEDVGEANQEEAEGEEELGDQHVGENTKRTYLCVLSTDEEEVEGEAGSKRYDA